MQVTLATNPNRITMGAMKTTTETAVDLLSYTLRDRDSGVEITITANDDDDANEQAREWARGGDWDASGGTLWVDVVVTDPNGDHETITVAIDPDPPKCTEDEHDWQSPFVVLGGLKENPGVQGHGGGVIIREVCSHCGAYQVTDTWAQRSDTGEQGLRSVSFKDADEESLAWVESLTAGDEG